MSEYLLYVDGQLGLPFDSYSEALKAALLFEKEGFECTINKPLSELKPHE